MVQNRLVNEHACGGFNRNDNDSVGNNADAAIC